MPPATMSGASDPDDKTGDRLAPGSATGWRGVVHSDIVIALGIVAACAAIFAITLTFDTVPAALAQGMGPAAFPQLLLGVMVVLAGVLAWSSRGRSDEVRAPIPPVVYLTALGFVCFMAGAWLLGLFGAAFLAVIGFGLMWGERRWMPLVATAAFLCVVIYLVFVKGFSIPLPRGFIGERLP